MAAKAYVLIQAAPGKVDGVAGTVRSVAGVKEADVVTGPYDIIAIVEGADLNAVGSVVKQHIQTIEGIDRTLTCLSVS